MARTVSFRPSSAECPFCRERTLIFDDFLPGFYIKVRCVSCGCRFMMEDGRPVPISFVSVESPDRRMASGF